MLGAVVLIPVASGCGQPLCSSSLSREMVENATGAAGGDGQSGSLPGCEELPAAVLAAEGAEVVEQSDGGVWLLVDGQPLCVLDEDGVLPAAEPAGNAVPGSLWGSDPIPANSGPSSGQRASDPIPADPGRGGGGMAQGAEGGPSPAPGGGPPAPVPGGGDPASTGLGG
jgi:hypothetical protein